MEWSTKIIDFIHGELGGNAGLFLESPFWKLDPDLRKANLTFAYTRDEEREVDLVRKDLVYFCSNYLKALVPSGDSYSLQYVSLREYQYEVLEAHSRGRFNCVVKSRQIGMTLVMAAVLVQRALRGQSSLVVTNRTDTAEEVVEKAKNIYRGLPFYMKPGVEAWNAKSVAFDNGAKVYAVSAASRAAGVGGDFDFVFVDEAAHIPPKQYAEMMTKVMPVVNKRGGSVTVASTPNGYNHFYKLAQDGDRGANDYRVMRFPYTVVPGRDGAWVQREVELLGSREDFEREYNLQFGMSGDFGSLEGILGEGVMGLPGDGDVEARRAESAELRGLRKQAVAVLNRIDRRLSELGA